MHESRKDLGGFSGSEGMASRCVHLAYTHITLSLTALRESSSMKAFEMVAWVSLLDPNKHGVKQVQAQSQINAITTA